MKRLDLEKENYSIAEILRLAKAEPLLIRATDGEDFLVESADDIDRESHDFGESAALASFLEERSREVGDISLSEARKKRGL